MADFIEKKCPQCDQQLRFPKKIGGMLMACPSCGQKFYSDFIIAGADENMHKGMLTQIFELPDTLLQRLRRFFIKGH